MRIWIFAALFLSIALAGCSDDGGSSNTDMTTMDVTDDGTTDTASDADNDTQADTSDTGSDTQMDVSGDSTEDSSGDTIEDTTGDSTEDTSEDTTEDTGGDMTMNMDMQMGNGACTNSADMAIINMTDVQEVAASCGPTCFISPDQAGCVSMCVQMETGISAPCADCYGEIAECTISNCLGDCTVDSNSPECMACLMQNGCVTDFQACSGL